MGRTNEAADVINEANMVILKLEDILDDLKNARDRGAAAVELLFEGQFGVDHVNNDTIEVGVYKLKRAIAFFQEVIR